MRTNKYITAPVMDDPRYDEDLEEQIVRLRDVLEMMSPETGSRALGAMRQYAPMVPLAERVKALIAYQRQG
jgi:hypothetical protein